MKLNEFISQCKIGSYVSFRGRKFKVEDVDRSERKILVGTKWVSFYFVDLCKPPKDSDSNK